MKTVRKLGAVLAVLGCVAMAGAPAMANHKQNVAFLVRLPNINAVGTFNPAVGPIVQGNAQVNTKNGAIKAKAQGNVANASGMKKNDFKGLNGLVFQSNIPAGVAATLSVDYKVKGNSAKWDAKN